MSPLLFVFATICDNEQTFPEDLESYPELLQNDWYSFWENRGDGIVNTSWLELYSEYIVKETEVDEDNQGICPVTSNSSKDVDEKNCTQNGAEAKGDVGLPNLEKADNCTQETSGVGDLSNLEETDNRTQESSGVRDLLNLEKADNCTQGTSGVGDLSNLEETDTQEALGVGDLPTLEETDNRRLESSGVRDLLNLEKADNCTQETSGVGDLPNLENADNCTQETSKVGRNLEEADNCSKETSEVGVNLEGADNYTQETSATQTWQELWDDHYLKTYQNTYELFQVVHYRQYCFHRPGLTESSEEAPPEEVTDFVEFTNQAAELKALGLPTSFAGRTCRKPRNNLSDLESEGLSEEGTDMPQVQEPIKKPKKKKNRKQKAIPKTILENKTLLKYWYKRFSLFSRFDEGIQLDAESWFSVTPEKVAVHMAERLACDTIIDGFCGSGGNAIQFAMKCSRVIAIDIDPEKIKNARHNASIYGVANKIDFIVGDFLQLSSSLKGDVVFLSPPWGGPKYISAKEYDIEESLEPVGATELAEKSRHISENVVFFLPKNSNREQIKKLAGAGKRVEIEQNYLDVRFVGLTAIYGDWLIDKRNLCK